MGGHLGMAKYRIEKGADVNPANSREILSQMTLDRGPVF